MSRPQGNGTQTASHADANQQHDHPRSRNQQYFKQTPKVHGNETTLDPVQNCSTAISTLLATRTQQPRQLRNKIPCGNPPQGGPRDLLDTKTQTGTFSETTKHKYICSKGVLDSLIGITKLKDLQIHSQVQIPISTFHVEHRVPTFLPRRIASDRTCK